MMLTKLCNKVWNVVLHPQYHRWNFAGNRCNVCKRRTLFLCDDPSERWIRKCLWCRSVPKYRAIMHVIEETLGQQLADYLDDPDHSVYELGITSPIWKQFRKRSNYTISAHYPDRPFKQEIEERVFNEDVQDLGFEDESFSLIISSETMEHVREPEKGFGEILRVLKPKGIHCFTVPFHSARKTRRRIEVRGDEDIEVLPPEYHGDPYDSRGSLVYSEFGTDLLEILEQVGFVTSERLVLKERQDIQDDLGPMRVFVSRKPAVEEVIPPTGAAWR